MIKGSLHSTTPSVLSSQSPVNQELILVFLKATSDGNIQEESSSAVLDSDAKLASENVSDALLLSLTDTKLITFDLNKCSINDIINEVSDITMDKVKGDKKSYVQENVVNFILHYNGGTTGNTKKTRPNREEREQKQQWEDDLVATLSEQANTTDLPLPPGDSVGNFFDSKESRSKRKDLRRRREERGFRGTFLQSFSSTNGARLETGEMLLPNKDEKKLHNIAPRQRKNQPANDEAPSAKSFDHSCKIDVVCIEDDEEKESDETRINKGKSSSHETVEFDSSDTDTNPPVTDEVNTRSLDVGKNATLLSASLCLGLSKPGENPPSRLIRCQASPNYGSEASSTSVEFPLLTTWPTPKDNQQSSVWGLGEPTNIKRRPPDSKYDLSLLALSYTRPIFTSAFPLEDNDGKFWNCELEFLERKHVHKFVQNAREIFFNPQLAHQLGEMNSAKDGQCGTELLANLKGFLPKAFPSDHVRHLCRNFIDSKDPVGGPLSESLPYIRLNISRREMDIILFCCSTDKTYKDCHSLMPYRKKPGLRRLFINIRALCKHRTMGAYMSNVEFSVKTLFRLEGHGFEKNVQYLEGPLSDLDDDSFNGPVTMQELNIKMPEQRKSRKGMHLSQAVKRIQQHKHSSDGSGRRGYVINKSEEVGAVKRHSIIEPVTSRFHLPVPSSKIMKMARTSRSKQAGLIMSEYGNTASVPHKSICPDTQEERSLSGAPHLKESSKSCSAGSSWVSNEHPTEIWVTIPAAKSQREMKSLLKCQLLLD